MTNRKNPEALRAEMLEQLAVEGLPAAVAAAISVCQDSRAPAPARATAAGLIFRALEFGGFGTSGAFKPSKEHHEMSPEELDEALEQARAELRLQTSDRELDVLG